MSDVGHKEEGTVLLTTLLVMAIMAALAVAMMDDIRFALKRTANVFMQLNVREGSHCFNLTSLTNSTTGEADEDAKVYFVQTYETLIDNPLVKGSGIENISERISDTIAYEPISLWVELELSYRKAQRARSFNFNIDNDRPVLTYRGWGRESFRPSIKTETTQNSSGRE